MKNIEKILGAIIIIFMLVGLLVNLPFLSLILILLTILLTFMYFWFGFALLNNVPLKKIFKKEAYKGISTWRIIGSIGTGFALSITIIGILFVYQRWPYGRINLLNGLYMLGVILVVILLKKKLSFHKFYTYIILRIGIVGLIGLVLLYLPAETLLEMRCHDCPKSYLEAEKALLKDPNNPVLLDKVNQEWIKMNETKKAEE